MLNINGARKTLLIAAALVVGSAGVAGAATILPGDLTTGGTATGPGTGQFGDGAPLNAFDDNANTKAGNAFNPTPDLPANFTYTFAGNTPALALSYSLTSGNDSPNRDPRDFQLLGSNDAFATAGTVVDTRTDVQFVDTNGINDGGTDLTRRETIFFTIQNPGTTPFSSYRLAIQETKNAASGEVQFAELQLFATVVPEPASAAMVALGILTLGARRRRRV